MDKNEVHMNKNEIQIALEMLLEQIEQVVNATKESLVKARRIGNLDTARELATQLEKLTQFWKRAIDLQKEWGELSGSVPGAEARRRRRKRRPPFLSKRIERFRQPILEALVELGGRANASKVLQLVEQRMRPVLTQDDYQRLPSGEVRWRKAAQWARYALVQEGFLRSDSPHGVWEISEAGRQALAEGRV